ncbi:MAG: type II toxin-antitoxin system VapC family toxin [Thermoanaerobaculia bacterium]|nr:type II toxin-antitoxin system VapC family toxin [Thermoanaerobaculia bacterium]
MSASMPRWRRAGAEPPLLAVDSRLFVYHFEGHELFGEPAGRILAAAEEGRCRLVTSVVALLEVLVVPKRLGRTDLADRYREFFHSFPNLTVVAVDAEIAERAAALRAEHSLRTPDALHLATAETSGAAQFVSEDRRLARVEAVAVTSTSATATALW